MKKLRKSKLTDIKTKRREFNLKRTNFQNQEFSSKKQNRNLDLVLRGQEGSRLSEFQFAELNNC